MTDAKIFICGCGREHNGNGTLPPPGWEWRGSRLFCDDCIRMAAFSNANEASPPPQVKLPPNPIRTNGPADSATSILLRSGAYLDLADPDCSVIAPIDIASGLRQPRFAAQSVQPYTVAQHSVLVLSLVEPVADEIGGQKGLALKRCALMHDAAEAFIHDITSPLKRLLPDYRAMEAEFERRLFATFGVRFNSQRKELVKRADMQALAIEKRDVMGLMCRPAPAVTIDGIWLPNEAAHRFLTAFTRLFPEHERKAA